MRQHVIRITLLFALVLAHVAAVPAAMGANASNMTADATTPDEAPMAG